MKKIIYIALFGAFLSPGSISAFAQGVKPTGNPCDPGGTIYDPTGCDQLMKVGFYIDVKGGNKTVYMKRGKTTKGHLQRKAKLSNGGVTLIFRDAKEHSKILARCKTNSTGDFTVTIPSNFSGSLGITIGPNPTPTEPDGGFCYETLPSDNNCLNYEEAVAPSFSCSKIQCPLISAPPANNGGKK